MFYRRSDWLLNHYSLIHHQFLRASERRQTRVGCEQNAFPASYFRKYIKKVTEFGLEVLTGKALSFWLEWLSIKPVKKFFVYKCKLSLSLALLYLVDLFINKLKTKFNNLFYRIISNTNRIHNSFWRNFPARAKQTPSKVLFVAKK